MPSFLERNYRRLRDYVVLGRLGKMPRLRETTVGLMGRRVRIPDGASFVHMYREIFRREIYRFRCEREDPFIIDGGANIGLGILYFRKIFPRSRILAFEPDPKIFAILQA